MKKTFLVILIMIVFLTVCGKTHDEHSDIEETTVTEQASVEENEEQQSEYHAGNDSGQLFG